VKEIMEVNKIVYILYDGDHLWHERLLLGRVGTSAANRWLVLTPDRDMYVEELGRNKEDIEALRLASPDGCPPGVAAADTYNFVARPDAAEMMQIRQQARLIIESEALRCDDDSVQEDWRSTEDVDGISKGDKLVLKPTCMMYGEKKSLWADESRWCGDHSVHDQSQGWWRGGLREEVQDRRRGQRCADFGHHVLRERAASGL